MTSFVWQTFSILVLTLVFALSSCTSVPPSIPGDPIQVHIDAPDGYISGGVFNLQAAYEADGEITYVDIDDRLLHSDASFVVQLPRREQGLLKEIRAELRHPKYKPAFEVITASEISTPLAITVRPARWTTNGKHTWIKPIYETSVAGMEHLRWVRTEYFQRPERLSVNEAFQKDHQLVAQLAYKIRGKSPEWVELRLANIAEWEAIAKIMEERSLGPCPPGYVLETLTNRPCGALVFKDTYPDPETLAAMAAEKEKEEKEQWRQIQFARADLAKRLQMDQNSIRFAGHGWIMWDSAAVGCPEEGKMYKEEETPGYIILLQPPNETYYYHGKVNELPSYCDEDKRTY